MSDSTGPTRKTLKDFLLSDLNMGGEPAAGSDNLLEYILERSGPNDTIQSGDDLADRTWGETGSETVDFVHTNDEEGTYSENVLLGNFASYITQLLNTEVDSVVKENPSHRYVEKGMKRSLKGNRGENLRPAEDTGANSVFVETSAATLGDTLSQYSNSGQFGGDGAGAALGNIINKVGRGSDDMIDHEGTGASGDILLRDVSSTPADGSTLSSGETFAPAEAGQMQTVKKGVNSVLSNNRFTNVSGENRSAFAAKDVGASSFDQGADRAGTILNPSRNQYGIYSNTENPLPEADSYDNILAANDTQRVTYFDRIKNIGTYLMYRAAGLDDGETLGDFTIGDGPQGAEWSSADEASPGTIYGQFVSDAKQKIDVKRMEARHAPGAPADFDDNGALRPDSGVWIDLDPDDPGAKSFGASFSPGHPFSSEGGQALLIGQAASAIEAALEACKGVFENIDEAVSRDVRLGNGPYIKGESTRLTSEASWDFLFKVQLADVRHPYSACVKAGFKFLFSEPNASAKSLDVNDPDVGSASNISPIVGDSPGFWYSVARSIVRDVFIVSGDVESFVSSPNYSGGALSAIMGSKTVGFLNALAITGDAFITAYGLNPDKESSWDDFITGENPVGRFNVDMLPEDPATRIMKSRSDRGHTALSLAWRGGSVPAMYMIPTSVMRTSLTLGTMGTGTNPLRAHLGTELFTKTYLDGTLQGENSRIPMDIVERFENSLDAEYVPFYFHDVRTNEIISFHAFLTSLTDRFQPSHTATAGLGRMDSVRTYKSTTRSLGLSFYVVATSKSDFDEMWFKINKLTTLIYPKWSGGTQVSVEANGDTSTFIQPFSQVMSASPLIRLRVGDVIKGNYSRFNLARLFGIGDGDHIKPKVLEEEKGGFLPNIDFLKTFLEGSIDGGMKSIESGVFNVMFNSPLASLLGDSGRDLRAVASQALINGFVNPIGATAVTTALRSPDTMDNPVQATATLGGIGEAALAALDSIPGIRGYIPFISLHYLRANNNQGYFCDGDGRMYRTVRPIRVLIGKKTQKPIETSSAPGQSAGPSSRAGGPGPNKSYYTVTVMDFNVPLSLFGRKFTVTYSDILPDPKFIFMYRVLPFISLKAAAVALLQQVANMAATASGLPADSMSLATLDAAKFMQPEFNPVTKAFENTAGRGLAGTINSLSFDWLEFPWEVDWNSRAPIACKVTMGFDVIHDIPPGLDQHGYNRAPIYNVGEIVQNMAGDQYGDDGLASRDTYTRTGGRAFVNDRSPIDKRHDTDG